MMTIDNVLEFFNAKSDEEVTRLVKKLGKAGKVEWNFYGDNPNNQSIINAQMTDPLRCLAELLVNSVDSMKMLEVMKDGVDLKNPSDPRMPKSNEEALDRYFKDRKSKDIGMIFEKTSREDSRIVLYDFGEGQRPDRFRDTLLSLNRGNKKCLPFVQGKYNMGSTGVFKKCNGKRYQLIMAKRNPDLPDADGLLGFTLIRYTDAPEANSKLKYYEYMTFNGEIPAVKCSKISLPNIGSFKGGCIRKLYSYNLDMTSTSYSISCKLNSLFYDTQLPVRLLFADKKETGTSHDNSYNIIGVHNRILNSDRVVYQNNAEIRTKSGNAKVEYFVFKPVKDKEKSNDLLYINGHSVSFIDNGQNNGDFDRSFLSMDCQLTQLSKNMMVFVDTSSIPTHEMSDFYQASRDRIDIHDQLAKNVIAQLKGILLSDERLTELNDEYTGKDIRNADGAKIKESVMSKLSKIWTIQKMLNEKSKGFAAEHSGIRAVVEKEPSKPVTNLINFGDEKTVHITHGRNLRLCLSSSADPEVYISDDSLTRNEEDVELDYSYSLTEKGPFTEYLFNSKAMGYLPDEKFTISFVNTLNRESAVIHVIVTETKTEKKEKKLKIDGPTLVLTTRAGDEGSVAWNDLPFEVNEGVICRLVPSVLGLDMVYVNLDSNYYRECVKGKIYSDAAKNRYIEDIYMQGILEYLGQLEAFEPVFKENENFGRYKADILELLAKGSETSIRNRISCNLAA